MAERFGNHPNQLRDMANRFEVHAGAVEDEERRIRASTQNTADASGFIMAQGISAGTAGQMHQAFRNIVAMLRGVRDELIRDANDYRQ